MVEDPEAADEIEVAVVERQRLAVAGHERAVVGSVLARRGEVLLGGVDADHLADERRDRIRERARPAADVEHALVTAERSEQPRDLRRERGMSLGLERTAEADPVAHPTTSRAPRPGATRIPQASS